jgi:GntR family transcriptional regulator
MPAKPAAAVLPLAAPSVAYGFKTPLYQQVYMSLRERIISGELAAGSLLAGEQEMARAQGVSRITIKRAFNELAARGLVHRQRGRGTTVAGGAVIPLVAGSFDTLVESLQRMGLQTEIELIEVRNEAAGAKIGERLEIEPEGLVQRAVRMRKLSGTPFSYLINYVPAAIADRYSKDDLASTSMLTLLERAGASPQEAEQWISAVSAPPAIAAALDVTPGSPLLKIDRVMRGSGRRPVQFIEVHYRPDRFHYHFRTQRGGRADDGWRIDG